MARSKRKKKTKNNHSEIKSIVLISFGLLAVFSLHTNSVGKFGQALKLVLLGLFSRPAFLIPYLIVFFGILSIDNLLKKNKAQYIVSSITLYLSTLVIYTLISINHTPLDILSYNGIKTAFFLGNENNGIGGGVIGSLLTKSLTYFFGIKGSYIIIFTIIILTLLLTTSISLKTLVGIIMNIIRKGYNKIKNYFVSMKNIKDTIPSINDIQKESNEDNISKISINDEVDEKIKILDYTSISNSDTKNDKPSDNNEAKSSAKENIKAINKDNNDKDNDSVLNIKVQDKLENYSLPSLDLLNVNNNNFHNKSKKEILNKAKTLEKTLNNFGVDAKVVQISKGPTITRFEIQPSPGVKVSKIVNLTDDIALNLAAQNIRVEAPIPGKSAVGIEVPNENSMLVGFREVIESNEFISNDSKLTFILGKDISGNPIVADLAKMPHMLIAGATGSGKSVCVNTLINSILYKATPDEVKFLLIDPKVVELSNYNGIPHLLLPVVTDPKKAATALNWVVQEMTNRYKLFAKEGVRNIDSYNEKMNGLDSNMLPKLVVIIDELADLMIVAPNQVEDAICRLAQMARAAGIHLIVATQRPSVDVITGVIKANIPSRIAFAVSSQVDSRTILDMGGAEKLLGKGDMLFYPVGESKPKRVQGCFISDTEVKNIVDFIQNQVEEVNYEDNIMENIEAITNQEEVDELLPEAIELVVDSGKASISMLQRRFRIGYNRAARIIDEMEKRNIVSGHLGSKPRDVLVTKEEFIEINNKSS